MSGKKVSIRIGAGASFQESVIADVQEAKGNAASAIAATNAHTTKQGDLTQLNTSDKSSIVNALKEVKTQATANTTAITTKTDKSYVDTQIQAVASGSPKGTYATLSALQTAFPTGNNSIYLVTADGKWYYWSGSAWTAGGTYQSTGISKKSLTIDLLDDRANLIDYSYNLLDLTQITHGYAVQSDGTPFTNATFSISDFIPVNPGDSLVVTKYAYWGAYYDKTKVKLGVGYTTTTTKPFTVPANAYFVRCTLPNTPDSDSMIYIGTDVNLPFRAYMDDFVKANRIKTNTIVDKNVTLPKIDMDALSKYFSTKDLGLLQELKNPHKKTRIVLFGDSITQGLGATGTSFTGTEFITGVKQDVYTSNSWANKLRTHLNEHFNKMVFRSSLNDPNVTTTNGSSLDGSYYGANNVSGRAFLTTTFKGDTAKLLIVKNTNYGIFDVYVNSVFNQTIDCYNSSAIDQEITITGGNTDTSIDNLLELKETNTKNASSTDKLLQIKAIGYNKIIDLQNYGISGAQSHAIVGWLKQLTTVNDDVIILMCGTNDRSYYDAWRTYSVLADGIPWIKANRPNSKLVIMSANPCGKFEFDDTTNYKSHMEDIDMAIRQAAIENSITFISHYKDMTKYLLDQGKPVSYFTGDNVHPNDIGHQFMANNLMEKIGLAIKMNVV